MRTIRNEIERKMDKPPPTEVQLSNPVKRSPRAQAMGPGTIRASAGANQVPIQVASSTLARLSETIENRTRDGVGTDFTPS